jgi:hypothetical protein
MGGLRAAVARARSGPRLSPLFHLPLGILLHTYPLRTGLYMQLWNDYEGRTIAEAYPLKKLIRPEGRSAFFLTTNGTGTPAMVRLIEAHFDEPEILSRWRMVSEIKQENLVEMRKYGETVLDGTPLVYAVMEPTEMSLADLLRNRTVNVEEAKQLAYSLIQALAALHARGLVHEHVRAENILAVGETVKLRSDCVREAGSPDGDEAEVSRRKAADAHDLAALLLEAMTGRRTLQGSATVLPPPFDAIIRNGLSDKWGLPEMAAALGPVSTPKPAAATPPSPAAPKPETKVKTETEKAAPLATAATGAVPARTAAETVASKPASAGPLFETAESARTSQAPKPVESKSVIPTPAARNIPHTQAPDVRHRIVKPVEKDPRRTQLLIVAAVAILVLLFFGWRLTRSGAGAATDVPRPTETAKAPSATSAPAATTPTPAPSPANTTNAASSGRTQWHVVAYTYNHEDQAQKKAAELKAKYPALNPDVFTPTGRSPYLVTVGGAMTREDALAFKRKARSAGLPRDIYAQNYAR